MENCIDGGRLGEARIYAKPKRYVANTPIIDYKGRTYHTQEVIRESQIMLNCLSKIDRRNDKKYKETEKLLKGIILLLENQQVERPRKKQLEYMIDVFKELSDINARSEAELHYNEEMSEVLKILVEIFMRE